MTDAYVTEKEYADDFINLLHRYKTVSTKGVYFKDQEPIKDPVLIKSSFYLAYLTFKALICELFYQAIRSIPHDISEYTIHCTNNKGVNQIVIGIFDDLDDDGEIAVTKIITPDSIFVLNKVDVHNFYIANRSQHHDKDIINSIMMLLYMDGDEPRIKTSYKSVAKQHFYKKLKN